MEEFEDNSEINSVHMVKDKHCGPLSEVILSRRHNLLLMEIQKSYPQYIILSVLNT